ncbi:hypothetical protein FB45DRAFT_960224 [Roridomyces roridus]|uniref:Uncharacterized protein n=1 Tax=Roridomyces roridus TaxID=1738132 RepID=A0AAD7F5W9_9AGAR|nr:hypothetical protein FB45DRAFT_960224 [Roridomyces roridus]
MAMSVEPKNIPQNKPGTHPALAYRPQDYMAAAAVGPLVYPTTTTAGWTVVHHGNLGPPREPYVPPSSTTRRAHSATRNLPISGSSSSSSPAIPSATPARPLPVPPPLDTINVGSTTFTRRPNAGPVSPPVSDKGKRRASISALAIPGPSPDLSGPASAISPLTGRPLPPLPPPVAGSSSSSRPVASSSSQAGPSRKSQKSPRKDSRTRQRTPDAAFRVANPSASASSSFVAPTTTRPNAGPSPTLPFDGVSGVWAPRPATDSHSRGVVTGHISRKASPSLSRKPSADLLPSTLSRKMSSEAMQERERTIRKQASAEQQRITAGQQLSRRPSIQRENSGGAKKKGSAPNTPAAGTTFNVSPAPSGAVLGVANIAKRKSSLPPGVGAGGAPPSPRTLTHSRSPSSSTPVNTNKPPPPPPLVTARPTHGRAASLSGPLVPPPPPPLLPYGEGSRSATTLAPATPFVPPPPPPPLVTIRTAAARVAARGTVSPGSSPSSAGSSGSPTPSPVPPPPLTMGAVLRAQRGSPASAGLHGGHPGYTTSPLASSASTANSTPASSAWHRWDDGSGSGSGSGWSEESPATAATTPASSRDWHGSDMEKEFETTRRDRRRAQFTSPIDVDVGVVPGPLTPPIHSHPLDEDDGANPDSARDENGNNPWLSALEGEVQGEEMNGVSLSPPVFATSGDPDLDDEFDDDELDLYDDMDVGNDQTFTAPAPEPQRDRSPSPMRYARRTSVDADMILSDSSDEDSEDEKPIPDGASMDSGTPSFDAKSTFSRARSVRSRRRRRNTRAAPPPVPLASAAGLNRRRSRSRSADSSDGYREAMAPSEMWKMEQMAKAGSSQTEMRVYRAGETRLPASIPPPMLGASDSYASLSTGSPSASQSGHGSTELGGYGYRTSPNTSKSSLPLALPTRKDTLKLLRRDKNKDKDKSRDRSMRKSSSFSLLRGNHNAADKSMNSSMEGLVLRAYPERYERASTSSSGGSDEAGQQGRPMRVGGGGSGGKGLRNYLYDPTR